MVAARITAEDPSEGFKPNGGALHSIKPGAIFESWSYFSVTSNAFIHDYSDSQFGHVFSCGASRPQAIKNLGDALQNTQISADFRTNVNFVTSLLAKEEFVSNQFSTSWLDEMIKRKISPHLKNPLVAAICAAAIIAETKMRLSQQYILDSLQKRQYPTQDQLKSSVGCKFVYKNIGYEFQVHQTSKNTLKLVSLGQELNVSFQRSADGIYLIAIADQIHCVHFQDLGHALNLIVDNYDCLIELDNDPSSVRSPSSGRIVKLLVESGSKVAPGTPLCEIEVMKMYLPILSQGSGIITFKKTIGSSIHSGDLLASIELDNLTNGSEIKTFSGNWSAEFMSGISFIDDLDIFEDRLSIISAGLNGFYLDDQDRSKVARDLFASMTNPALPLKLVKYLVASVRPKLPSDILTKILDLATEASEKSVLDVLKSIDSLLSEDDPIQLCIKDRLRPHFQGPMSFSIGVVHRFVEDFVSCEVLFDSELTVDGPLRNLFGKYDGDLNLIMATLQMHYQLESRQEIIVALLDCMCDSFPDCLKEPEFIALLKSLTTFQSKDYGRISRYSREIILSAQKPSLENLFKRMESRFEAVVDRVDDENIRSEFIKEMVQGFTTHIDVLPQFFHHKSRPIQRLALEIYTRRVFSTYILSGSEFLSREHDSMSDIFVWNFATGPNNDSAEELKKSHRKSLSSTTVYPLVGIRGQDMYSKLDQQRRGYMLSFDRLGALKDSLESALHEISSRPSDEPNHLYLVTRESDQSSDDDYAVYIQQMINSFAGELALHRVRRLTVAVVRKKMGAPGFFTYSQSHGYKEDLTLRHIEPAIAYLLEFPRLANYEIELCYADMSGQAHIYLGTERRRERTQRLFVRLVVRPQQTMRGVVESMAHFATQAMHVLDGVLEAMEAVQAKSRQLYEHNHLFISIEPVFHSDPSDALSVLQQLAEHYSTQWAERHIRQVEVRMSLSPSKDTPPTRYRYFLNNETGYVPLVHGYREEKDASSGFKFLTSLDGKGPLNGWPVTFYYGLISPLQVRRARVLALETPYIYDFPSIFEHALGRIWKRYASLGGEISPPTKLLEATELILQSEVSSNYELKPIDRLAGHNTIGMVAWKMRIFTPEAPTGREIIVIGNDISFEIGSFGVEEDRLFKAASSYARKNKIPRIYLAANSGARLGLADELKNLFKVSWTNPDSPDSGFDYLYLDEIDYESLKPGIVHCERIVGPNGDIRYRVCDIIGAKHGLGVENLSGSALIAGETSRAYEDIFTLSYVTGRSVGIGAYLVRLGQRVIQKYQQPIILTGVGALNSVLGREVYQSNLQLGGPQVMYANGVSHRVVKDDLEGVQEILQWLSFVPIDRLIPSTSLPPSSRTRDNPNRSVNWSPQMGVPYDPRNLIEGAVIDGQWVGGLFDRGSFIESMSGWAKTVVTGRARLGGIPVGVIAVETRTVELVIPADPADLSSRAQTVKQAGQVWFPDSAFKTAQAIRDFTHGENLPIMILANWRGFSGGQRDLYEQVLKFGSFIVDALTEVKQPVFVYLPPGAELRGGAWVVVDSKINSEWIEMYADTSARGGILEPEGVVGVKFRPHHLHALMERIDPSCHELAEQCESASTPEAQKSLAKSLQARRAKLLPIYRQVAAAFADAHDTPGRMKAKGAIRDIVSWKQSRSYFFHRLRRLQAESQLVSLVKGYRNSLSERKQQLEAFLTKNFAINIASCDDELIFDQLSEHMAEIRDGINRLNIELAKEEITRIASEMASDLGELGIHRA